MITGWFLAVIFYVLGALPTYCLFDETTEQSLFNKIWFSAFWPATAVGKFAQWLVKKKNK